MSSSYFHKALSPLKEAVLQSRTIALLAVLTCAFALPAGAAPNPFLKANGTSIRNNMGRGMWCLFAVSTWAVGC